MRSRPRPSSYGHSSTRTLRRSAIKQERTNPMHGTFERGEPPRRRGTKLAPELDRRLGTNEDLVDVIEWWHEAWRAALRLSLTFHRTEDCQPKNFSDNELAVFVLVMTSGCGIDNRGTELHWLWSMLGFDCA